MSEVLIKRQTIRVTEVGDVAVSAIEDGDTPGTKLRAIKIYGPTGTSDPPVLELQLEGATSEDIRITTPEVDF